MGWYSFLPVWTRHVRDGIDRIWQPGPGVTCINAAATSEGLSTLPTDQRTRRCITMNYKEIHG